MKLQTRLFLFFIPVATAGSVAVISLAHETVQHVLVEDIVRRQLSHRDDLSVLVALALKHRSEPELLPLVQNICERTGAAFAMIQDRSGEVIAHSNVSEKGHHYVDALFVDTLKTDMPRRHMQGTLMEIALPIHDTPLNVSDEEFVLSGKRRDVGRRLGVLRFGIPLGDVLESAKAISRQLGLILIGLGAAIVGCGLIILRYGLAPIRDLVQATDRIRRGELGVSVDISRQDELGELAREFNEMSRNLAESTVSKEYVTNILDNMADMLIVLGSDGLIQAANVSAYKRLQYNELELVNQRGLVLFDPKESEHALLFLSRMVTRGRLEDVDTTFQTQQGEAFPVLLSGAVFSDKHRHQGGIILVAKDMTDRQKMEADLLQSAKLSAVGRLASGVAHEINNPLAVILGFAQGMLERIPGDSPFQRPLHAIERETQRCKGLVQTLLTFSRVTPMVAESMDVNAAVESALSLVVAQARMGGVELNKELPPDLPPIFGNGNQIQQVMINLANNALDAMKNKGVLTVQTKCIQQENQEWVGLVVQDTGSGIPENILPKIFEPFFTTKPVGQGTGLGLGLVHEIVQKHNGTIEVQSRPGFTEFLVKFPAHRQNSAGASSVQAA